MEWNHNKKVAPISSHRKRGLNFLAVFWLSYLLESYSAAAQVSHGTYFAFNLSADYLVIAIDSRRQVDTLSGIFRVDDSCKILPLNDRAVFLAEGIIANADARADRFDGFLLALAAFRIAPQPASFEKVAQSWVADLRTHLQTVYPFYSKLFDRRHGGEIVTGYFLGNDADGQLGGYRAKIIDKDHKGFFETETERIKKPPLLLPGAMRRS